MAPHVSMPHHHPLSLPSFPFLLLLFLSLSLLCAGWSTGGEEAGVVRPERRRKSAADDGQCGGEGGGNVGQGTGAASPAHARRRTSGPRLSQQGGEPGAMGAQRHGGRRRLVQRHGHPVLLLFFFIFLLPLILFLFFPSNGVARSALAAGAATLARGGVAVQRTAFSDGGGRHQHGHASLGWRLRHGLPGSDRVQWQRSAAPEMAWRAARRWPGQPAGCSSFFSFL